jgi:hypothetical protein
MINSDAQLTMLEKSIFKVSLTPKNNNEFIKPARMQQGTEPNSVHK